MENPTVRRSSFVALLATLALIGCVAQGEDGTADTADGSGETALGPVDGHDLPPTDLDRVQAGDVAPDFTLVSLAGPRVTLSDLRGQKNVVLVFYRGHW